MKSTIAVLLAASLLAGCESKNEYGDCIGAFDDGAPGVKYKVSTRNAIVGIIFFELVAPPVFVVAEQARCPIAPTQPIQK